MSAQTPSPSDSTPPELGGLNPRDLIAGGLQSAVPRPQGWQPPEPEILARLLPQYQIEAFLGRGGMGAVYRGRQIALDRAIALKLLPAELTADAEFVGRFQREARTLAKLQHPGIVAIYDFGQTTEGHLYFVMEYVDGTDLHRIIHGPGVNPAQALEIVGQVCEALQYAHTHGVMHRDIKPANVLLTQDGRAKLADFGLARPTHDDSGGFTRSNVVMGTPDYIAPEQMYGQADHRADLFSLGVMLYEMLTGQTPRGAWAPPSQRVRVDVRLDQVVIRALQHDVAMRYQQASEMKIDVDTIRTTPLPVATQAKKPQPPQPRKPASNPDPTPAAKVEPIRRKKSSNAWTLAVVLPLIAAAIGYWAMNQPSPKEEPAPATPSHTATTADPPSSPQVHGWQAITFPQDTSVPGITQRADRWLEFGPRANGNFVTWKASAATPEKTFAHVALRVRYKRQPAPEQSVALVFRSQRGGPSPTVTFWATGLSLSFWEGSRKVTLAGSPGEAPKDEILIKPAVELKPGDEGVLEMALAGDRVLVCHNGKLVIDHVQPGLRANNEFEVRGQSTLLRDVEYRRLKDTGDAVQELGWQGPVSTAKAVEIAPAPSRNPPPSVPALQVPIPESFRKALEAGGRLAFFKTADLPSPHNQIFDLGTAAQFDDFVEVYVKSRAWYARRKNGEVWGKVWPTDGSVVEVGPLKLGFISRQASNFLIVNREGKVIQSARTPQRIDEPSPPGVASIIGNTGANDLMLRILLDSQGRTLHTQSAAGLVPPPADFFLNARAATATVRACFAAELGKPFRTWDVKTGAPLLLSQPIPDDVVDMDAGSSSALLLRPNGSVISIISDGRVNDRLHGPPAGLGPAIRVQVAGPIHAAQKPDGAWTTWTPWVGDELTELARAISSLGPVIDLDADVVSISGSKSAYTLYIKPGDEISGPAAPRTTATTPPSSAALPADLKVPIPESFRRVRETGGRLAFYKTKDLPAPYDQLFDLGEAANFDDFVKVYSQNHGWFAQRRNGEVWGKRWSVRGEFKTVGPLAVRFIPREYYNAFQINAEGQVVRSDGTNVQVDEPSPPGVAAVLGNASVKGQMMRLLLDAQGRILDVRADSGLTPPPPDFFLNAGATTATIGAYFAAEAGKPLRTWEAKTGMPIPFPQPVPDDIVAMDSSGSAVLLLRVDGSVVSISEGRINDRWNGAPADLGPVIQVRAGGSIHAAQKPDGAWAAWTPWTGDVHAELVRAAAALGPAIDLESGAFTTPNIKSEYLLYIKPVSEIAAAPAAANLTIPAAALAFGKSRYLLMQDKRNWNEANAAAQAQGGHLLTITSKEEDDFIRTTFAEQIKEGIWLGATCIEKTKTAPWVWTTGEPWNYSNWAHNQPDFGYGGPGRLLYKKWMSGLAWDDAAGIYPNAFVVEFEAPTSSASPPPSGTMISSSPPPTDELTARLADIHAKFQAAYDRDILPPHQATVATLDSNYLAAVNRALDAAAQRGDLEEAVQVRAEAKRVTDKQPMPAEDTDSTPAILKTLRATYRATHTSLEKDRDTKAKPYYDRYDGLLEAYQKELTQQGRLDDAVTVKNRRDKLRTDGATAQVPPPNAASPALTPQTISAPAIPKGATQDKVIDWVFSHNGEVTVGIGGKTQKAKSRQELPNQAYELWEINITKGGIMDKELAQLAVVPTLRLVSFSGKNEITTLKPFAALTDLRTLWIENTLIKEDELAHLAGLIRLEGLIFQFKDGTGEGLTHLRGHDKLKSIKIGNGSLSAVGAQAIAALPQLTNLTLDNFVQRKSQVHLALLSSLPNLTRFSLTHCQLGEDAFKAIAGMTKLTTLNLSDSEFDNRGFALLTPLGPTLKTLDMQYMATASDEGLRHIAANLPNLESINVSTGATATIEGIRELAKLPKLKNVSWWVKGMKAKDYQALADLPAIERITLNGTAITDDGLSAFPKSATLSFLNLDGNDITDKGLAHLQAIPKLRSVNLKSTKVTPAGFAAFQQARPQVTVTK